MWGGGWVRGGGGKGRSGGGGRGGGGVVGVGGKEEKNLCYSAAPGSC